MFEAPRILQYSLSVSVSVSVAYLADNAFRAHQASAHGGGVSANVLSYTCICFLNDSIELLEIMFDCRELHYLAVVGEKLFPNVWDECLI